MVKVRQDKRVADFLERCSSLLYADEAVNSLMLGLAESLERQGGVGAPPLLLRLVEGDRTIGAVLQTPQMNLILTRAQEPHLKVLATALRNAGADFPGVVGPKREVEIFSRHWGNLTGKPVSLGMAQMIYVAHQVEVPPGEGRLREAEDSDRESVAHWLMEFARESLPPGERRPLAVNREKAERLIALKSLHLWEVGGKAVSMANAGRPTRNGISISAVFTPRNLRRRGYASLVTAHLSQKMLNSGKKFCVLYTDLGNPTSNKIYKAIGYREAAESLHVLFA